MYLSTFCLFIHPSCPFFVRACQQLLASESDCLSLWYAYTVTLDASPKANVKTPNISLMILRRASIRPSHDPPPVSLLVSYGNAHSSISQPSHRTPNHARIVSLISRANVVRNNIEVAPRFMSIRAYMAWRRADRVVALNSKASYKCPFSKGVYMCRNGLASRRMRSK